MRVRVLSSGGKWYRMKPSRVQRELGRGRIVWFRDVVRDMTARQERMFGQCAISVQPGKDPRIVARSQIQRFENLRPKARHFGRFSIRGPRRKKIVAHGWGRLSEVGAAAVNSEEMRAVENLNIAFTKGAN